MKIIYDPKVYLAGKTAISDEQIRNFLSDENVVWETDATTPGDALPELAGRICYMSYGKPRPGGNKAYLDNIKESGHGSVLEHPVWSFIFTGISRSLSHELVRHRAGWAYCLAGDTEVYSGAKRNGNFDGVRKTWTMKQLYEWSIDPKRKGRIKLIKVRCFDGEKFVQAGIKAVARSGEKRIFRVTLTDGKTIRCSEHHRFLTPSGWKPVHEMSIGEPLGTNGLPAIEFNRNDLKERYHQKGETLETIATGYNCSPHTVRKWLKLFGLQKAVGVGMTGRTPPNKGKKYKTGYKHSEEIKAILAEQKRGPNNPGWKGDNASSQAGRLRAQRMFPAMPCEACGVQEGHRHHLDRNTLNNERSNIEFLCPACHAKRHIAEDGHASLLAVRWVAIASIEAEGVEETYDLEIDHPSHNFVANGFVTHNSQLSQRYVDESVAEYVIPPVIAKDAVAEEIWRDSVTASHQTYLRLVDELMEKLAREDYERYLDHVSDGRSHKPMGFHEWHASKDAFGNTLTDRTTRRKAARGTARSVLPNATETKIVASANARAIRHFIEMRASRHADVEIRKLAVAVLRVVQEESPNLFGDYTLVPLPDGTFEATTPTRKV